MSANNFEQIRFTGIFDIIIAKKSDEKKDSESKVYKI